MTGCSDDLLVAAGHIACRIDAGDVGAVIVVPDEALFRQLDAEFFSQFIGSGYIP